MGRGFLVNIKTSMALTSKFFIRGGTHFGAYCALVPSKAAAMSALPPWRLISPDGTLHIARSEAGLKSLAEAQGQRHSYFRNILGLQRSDAKGGTNNWQSLDKVKWLQHVITGEYVVVAGTAKHFVDTVSSGRPDMGFNLRTFQQLLANKLKKWTAWERCAKPTKTGSWCRSRP